MNIFITGGTGFIGSNLVNYFNKKIIRLSVIIIKKNPLQKN